MPPMSAEIRPNEPLRRSRRGSGWSIASVVFLLLWGSIFQVELAAAAPRPVNLLPSPNEVIAAVNQVRAAQGLPPYKPNAALMAAAQAHSEYQASIGSTTHTGAGGTSVLQRAIAAGYGGGAAVSVIENVWGGGKGSAQQAVNWWKGDSLHLSTLISTRHQDVGAGVASGSGATYYTLNVGAVTGAPGSAATQEAWSAQTTAQPGVGPLATSGPIFNPIQVATPGPDGSVVHLVEAGQTVWTIAATYNVSVAEVLRINGLNANSSFIVPGQKLVIQPPGSLPTATFALLNPEETASEPGVETQPTAERPTITPAASPTAVALLRGEQIGGLSEPDAPLPGAAIQNSGIRIDPVLLVIGAFLAGGLALVLLGGVLKRST